MSLDELERRFVRAAQHELGPSAADRERNQAALLERLAAEPWGGAGGAALDAPGHIARSAASGAVAGVWGAVRGSRIGMLGVGLVVGAVVGGWCGFGLGRSGWSASGEVTSPARVADAVAAPSGAASAPPEGSAAAAQAPVAGEAPGVPEPELPPHEAPPDEAAAAADAARDRALGSSRPRAARRAPAAPAQPESSLAVELAMLQRARRALNAENGRLALGIVEELDERFPRGVLVEERSATRILSLCQLERVAEATRAARDFLARYPSSVYAERVRQSCAASVP